MPDPTISPDHSARVSNMIEDVLRYSAGAAGRHGLDLDDVGIIVSFHAPSDEPDRPEPFRAMASIRANLDTVTGQARRTFDQVELAALFLSGTQSILTSMGIKFDIGPVAQAMGRARQAAPGAQRPAGARGARSSRARRPRR